MTTLIVGIGILLGMFLFGWTIYKLRQTGTTASQAARATSSPAGTTEEEPEAPIEVYRWVYFAALAATVLIGFYIGHIFTYLTFTIGEVEWNVGYLMWTLGAFLLVTRVSVVGPENMMGIEVLGIPTIVVSGAPVIIVPVVMQALVFSRGTIQMELPDEPENIYRNEDKGPVPEGKVPPIRITFAEGKTTAPNLDTDDPLNRRLTTEVSAFVRFRIERFWDFYVRIGDTVEARKQLADMTISDMQERLAQLTVAQTLLQLETLNEAFDELIRNNTQHWGIELIDARIKLLGLSHKLNESIQSISENTAKKQATILTAEGEERKRTLEGQGAANAVGAEILARAEAMKTMAGDLGIAGKDVLGAETARTIGSSPSSKIIVGADGMRELAGLGAVLGAAMKDETKPTQGA